MAVLVKFYISVNSKIFEDTIGLQYRYKKIKYNISLFIIVYSKNSRGKITTYTFHSIFSLTLVQTLTYSDVTQQCVLSTVFRHDKLALRSKFTSSISKQYK